jgi:hypothetical protein
MRVQPPTDPRTLLTNQTAHHVPLSVTSNSGTSTVHILGQLNTLNMRHFWIFSTILDTGNLL